MWQPGGRVALSTLYFTKKDYWHLLLLSFHKREYINTKNPGRMKSQNSKMKWNSFIFLIILWIVDDWSHLAIDSSPCMDWHLGGHKTKWSVRSVDSSWRSLAFSEESGYNLGAMFDFMHDLWAIWPMNISIFLLANLTLWWSSMDCL